MLTPEKWQDCWNYFRGEPQQVSGVWHLYANLQKLAPAVLDDEAEWLRKFRESPRHPNPLHCPFQSQRDNYRDANRTCFSSSCAMMLMTLRPGAIHSDDEYIRTVFSLGDTTDANTQLKALHHYGIQARFTTLASKDDIRTQIDRGVPVPCGYLHHGTPLHPTGGGHWCCVIGYDETGVIVHDPWAEMSLLYGTVEKQNGAKCHYSDRNWTDTRWQVEGHGTGYAIIAEP